MAHAVITNLIEVYLQHSGRRCAVLFVVYISVWDDWNFPLNDMAKSAFADKHTQTYTYQRTLYVCIIRDTIQSTYAFRNARFVTQQ